MSFMAINEAIRKKNLSSYRNFPCWKLNHKQETKQKQKSYQVIETPGFGF